MNGLHELGELARQTPELEPERLGWLLAPVPVILRDSRAIDWHADRQVGVDGIGCDATRFLALGDGGPGDEHGVTFWSVRGGARAGNSTLTTAVQRFPLARFPRHFPFHERRLH